MSLFLFSFMKTVLTCASLGRSRARGPKREGTMAVARCVCVMCENCQPAGANDNCKSCTLLYGVAMSSICLKRVV